jgi:hypothetical protein
MSASTTAKASMARAVYAQPSTLATLIRERYQVTKNISDSGTILSMVFERAICKLKRMSASPGDNCNARS